MPLPVFNSQWPWSNSVLLLYLLVSASLAVFLALILFPLIGVLSLFSLLIFATGLLLWRSYTRINQQVRVLLDCKSAQNGEVTESLLMIGQEQSPGVAILREDVLILIPTRGRRRKLPLEKIQAIDLSGSLGGKYLWGKTGLRLTTDSSTPLAFALPKTMAVRWFEKMTRN